MRTHHVIFALVACLGVSIGLVGVAQAGTLVGVTQCCPNQFVVVDPSTGALNPLSIVGDITVGFPAGASALDSDTHRFFLIRIQSGLPHLIAINTLTGAVDESPPLSPSLFALGFDSVAGTLVGVTQCCPNQFVVVDPSTGALNPLSIVGDITVGFPAGASALDSDTHRFFLIRIQSGLPHLIAINTLTGAVDESPPLSPSLFALGFDSVAGTLVGVTQCCPNQFVVVDPSTGALNPLSIVGDITVGFPAGASALDSDTHRFFLIRIQSGLPHLIAINTLTGAVDESPPLSPSLFALGFDSVAVPAQLVEIDIKPGSDPNSINCRMNGVIPVAILTTSDFDATTVDPSTVGFGPAAALRTHRRAHIQDADGDGDMDMVLHFRQQDTGIASGDEEACLTGETTDGTAIEGCDAIRTVGG